MSTKSALKGAVSTLYSNFFVTLPIPQANPTLSDQTFIVTGANGGLGFEACLHLVRLNVGRLVMAVRTESKGLAARDTIVASNKSSSTSIEVWTVDTGDWSSLKTFADRVAGLSRVDGVLANAGIMTTVYARREGHESTIAINVIGTALLYMLLLPTMRNSARHTGNPCRFVIPNSALHFLAPLSELEPAEQSMLERLSDADKALMGRRYPLSKLLVVYMVRALAARTGPGEEAGVIVNTPNPSFCKSNLAHESSGSAAFRLGERVVARSGEHGSRALVHGLLAGPESHGQYLTNCHVEPPSYEVSGQWGRKIQKTFFDELLGELERIQPGVSSHF